MTWKLPGYQVQAPLGSGTSGQVWRAIRLRTGEPVALKRLVATERQQQRAARTEAAILTALDHPHLIRLHEVVPTTDAIVLVLDLADGGSLADLLARRGRLTPGEVITALAPIGAALAYAHGQGVVHGDVSSANILFSPAGLSLLGDLGLARIIGDDAPLRATPAYVDPLVARGFVAGPASDVFSLAAVALHALTGRPVWTGTQAREVLALAARADLDHVPELMRDLPPAVQSVLARGLEVVAQRRGTAAEFALDLRHSADPAPVELAAGRERIAAGLERPDSGSDHQPAQLTYGRRIAAPPRPTEPEGWLARARTLLGRRGRLSAGLVVVLALSTLAVLRWVAPGAHPRIPAALTQPAASTAARSTGSASASSAESPTATATPSPATASGRTLTGSSAPYSIEPSSASTASSASASVVLDAGSARAVLDGLDRIRAAAYAQRNSTLLAQVYVAGPLLAEDVAELRRVVPTGCTMAGLRTTYSSVRVLATSNPPAAGPTALLVTASLSPATLMCGGASAGTSLGTPATGLRIELVRSGTGYRIAAQQLVT